VHTWSPQQEKIFGWFEKPANHSPNLVVTARAGTGKTTTLVEGLRRAPERRKLAAAFNKRIADELVTRLGGSAEAKTLHSIGFSLIRDFRKGIQVQRDVKRGELTRADWLTEQVTNPRVPDAVKKMISGLHSKGREINPYAKTFGDLTDILYQFDFFPDEEWAANGYDAVYVEQKAIEAMEVAATQPIVTGIDFADMIYLPVRNHWTRHMYDLGVVDEAQDMTLAQLDLFEGVVGGRKAVVGDDRQAIYGFRGADSKSLSRLQQYLKAETMELMVTRRCAVTIVDRAKLLVPDFEAHESNPTGEILDLELEKLVGEAANGDFILSRLNAPLVSIALSLLKNGKRARIAGKDIGKSLSAVIRKIAKGAAAHSIPALLERISVWEKREVDRMLKAGRESQAEMARDKADMLTELATASNSVSDLIGRIEALFTDDGLGHLGVITLSSVHKAKGLEADRVFVLTGTLRDHDDEERNIQYVAFTRAKTTLVMVHGA
jgi:DNA helicase-2/ATP-dependent DNA helicase PcrA